MERPTIGRMARINRVINHVKDWLDDLVWDDPDGGKIVLHGTIPTVVYPRKLRPSLEWHGLALVRI